MHHSIELEQVVGSLFDRLLELGLSFDGALIFTFDKEKRNIKLWIATTHLSDPAFIDIPYDEDISSNTIIRDLWAAIENEEVVKKLFLASRTVVKLKMSISATSQNTMEQKFQIRYNKFNSKRSVGLYIVSPKRIQWLDSIPGQDILQKMRIFKF